MCNVCEARSVKLPRRDSYGKYGKLPIYPIGRSAETAWQGSSQAEIAIFMAR